MVSIFERVGAGIALAVSGLCIPLVGQAQAPKSVAAPMDSVDRLAAARQAQARFERRRALRLPWTSGGGSRTCHEYVGRYCVWHDGADEDWVPPPEHRDVAEARDILLAELRRAAEAHPGDEWIAGQRVAYLIEANRLDDALDAVAGCAAVEWWCEALGGLVHHSRGETEAAERRFDRALATMPPGDAARWRDPEPLLSRSERRALASVGDPAALIGNLWWLADPLWMRAGNDRRAEHFARRTYARIASTARNVEGIRWGPDMEALLLRFGWPSGWERHETAGLERRTTIVTHRPSFGRDFVPPIDATRPPWRAASWPLTPAMPGSEYSPSYARFQGDLSSQLVVVPDGDSATIAAVVAFSHDSIPPDVTVDAALVAATPAVAIMDSGSAPARRTVRQVRVPRRDVVVSLETMTRAPASWAARQRLPLPVAARDSSALALSDPVLIDAGGGAPISRDGALARMLLPSEIATADSVAVYFEVWRLAPDVAVGLELALEPERGGTLRRIGESVGLASPRSTVRLAWQEPPPADGKLVRTVTLGFAAVPAARYTLHLVVRQDAAWGATRAPVDRRARR